VAPDNFGRTKTPDNFSGDKSQHIPFTVGVFLEWIKLLPFFFETRDQTVRASAKGEQEEGPLGGEEDEVGAGAAGTL